MGPSKPPARTQRRIRLGEQDIELLWFLAEHRMALPDHVVALLGVTEQAAGARLNRLAKAGYIETVRLFHNQPAMHLIVRDGLRVLGSALPEPKVDVHSYQHDVGVAWLWIAARRGTFGPLREVVGERRMRSHDGARDRDSEPFAVKLGGLGPWGRERLHYPDLLLRTADGRRVALELELSSKGRARRERILAGYAADPRFDGVVYLVQSGSVARGVKASARRLGVSSLIHIQRVRSTVTSPAAALAPVAERAVSGRMGRGPEAER